MLSRSVVRHLLAIGRILPEHVEQAERMRGFFGGRIESHLLKLGCVDEETLGGVLAAMSGVPYAGAAQLRAIPEEVMRGIPRAVIERHHVCPFHLEDRRLSVAMLDPRNRPAILELQTVTGHEVDPWITTEFRLYLSLERNYRIRFGRVRAISLAPPQYPGVHGTGTPEATSAPDADPVPEIGLDGLPLDAPVAISFGALVMPDETTEQTDVPEPAPPPPPGPSPAVPSEAPLSADRAADLDEALGAAWDRDYVADALLEFCCRHGTRAALFAVGRDGVRGVAGRGRGTDTASVRRVVLPVKSGTIFETALGSRDFYFGVVPALPPNRDLYTALGGRIPATVMLVPIIVKERTAALMYLDGDDAPLAHPDIPLMRRVAAKAGIAFELVLLRNKLRAI